MTLELTIYICKFFRGNGAPSTNLEETLPLPPPPPSLFFTLSTLRICRPPGLGDPPSAVPMPRPSPRSRRLLSPPFDVSTLSQTSFMLSCIGSYTLGSDVTIGVGLLIFLLVRSCIQSFCSCARSHRTSEVSAVLFQLPHVARSCEAWRLRTRSL